MSRLFRLRLLESLRALVWIGATGKTITYPNELRDNHVLSLSRSTLYLARPTMYFMSNKLFGRSRYIRLFIPRLEVCTGDVRAITWPELKLYMAKEIIRVDTNPAFHSYWVMLSEEN